MSKDTVILEQQTPLIHFQAEQEGAILRASELRPKIDKFIIHELEKYNKELFVKYEDEINDYFIKPYEVDKKVSPIYKLKIRSRRSKEVGFCSGYIGKKADYLRKQGIKLIDKVAYFGDNKSVFYQMQVYVDIFSYNPKIVPLIKEAIKYVCVLENFGTRQSKGFGGFLPGNISEKEFVDILSKRYMYIYYKALRNPNDKLQEIHKDYQLLKSGLTRPYKKSYLMEYMQTKNLHWDKRMIKHSLKSNADFKYIANNIIGLDKEEFKDKQLRFDKGVYARAMLGLAGNNEYQGKNGRYAFEIKDSENKIERYQSPILFKVFNNKIFVVANEVKDEMYDREFVISVKQNNNKELLRLNTPSKDEFNIKEFLNFALLNRDFGYKEVKTNE